MAELKQDISILVFVGAFLPGRKAGGPIRSLVSIVRILGNRNEFEILTLDRDLGGSCPYPGIDRLRWVPFGNAKLQYLPPDWRGWEIIIKNALRDDAGVMYLNSLFNRQFTLLPLWSRLLTGKNIENVLLAPRGETSSAALAIRSRRKRLYVELLRRSGVAKQIVFAASSSHEESDIRRAFGDSVTIVEMPVLPDPDAALKVGNSPSKAPGTLTVAHVARIHSHKNLILTLDMLARTKGGEIKFDIGGPIEDAEYWKKCQEKIALLPSRIKVRHLGELTHEEVLELYRRSHLMLLPTRSENFGHAIAEALLCGCPVLLSDTTPWRGLETAGVGWDLPLDKPELFTAAIDHCVAMGNGEHAAMREKAREFAVKRTMGEEVVAKVQQAFDFVAARPRVEPLRGKVLSAIARWGAGFFSKEVSQ